MDHDNRWHYSAIQAGQQVAGIGYKDNASSHFVVGVGGNPSQAYGSSSLYHSQYMEQWVNGSPRLKVDDSGRISMPYQPAFLAAVTGGVYTSGVFGGSLVTNHGLPAQRSSGYSNGTYTAPVSGLYQFNFNMYDFNSTAFTLAVYINGSGYIPSDWYQFATHANSQNTWSFQVYLNANDYIQMGIRGSSNINIYSGHTYWGGYLLG